MLQTKTALDRKLKFWHSQIEVKDLTPFSTLVAHKPLHSDASLEAVDLRAPDNSKNWSGRKKVTSDDRHLVCMMVNDRTAASRQLAARWSTATSILMSASRQFADVCCTVDCVQGFIRTGFPSRQIIDGCVCNGLMNSEPGGLIGNKFFSDESRFNLWNHDGRLCVRCCAGERCLLGCIIERHRVSSMSIYSLGCDFVSISAATN
ncbi:uncharacterized protein TNCV_4545281 [Trichonephila clavipes]|nr:uncharacterized protein TNCV_4545281 [Trichonephila clavipes]